MLYWILAVLIAAGGGYFAGDRRATEARDNFWSASISSAQNKALLEREQWTRDYRALEERFQDQATAALGALAAEKVKNEALTSDFTRLRLERNGLRDQLRSFAAGGAGGAAADSLTSCRNRAETLGVLLDEALRTSEEGARDGSDESAKLRTVRSAWPTGEVK